MKVPYKDIPEDVRDFLYGPEVSLAYDEIMEQQQLAKGSDATLVAAVEAVLRDQILLSALPEFLEKGGVPKEKVQKISADVAARAFLPVEKFFGDVAGQIRAWGGQVATPASGIGVAQDGPLTAERLVSKTLAEKKLQLADQNLEHRLELALVAYMKGVRDREETLQLLMRAVKVGGLAMPENDAEKILHEIDNAKGLTDIVSEKPKPAMLRKEAPKPVLSALPAQPVMMQGKTEPKGDLAPAISTLVDRSGVVFASAELEKRFRSIVESRLRDVRNAFETRALLEASVDKNGIGLRGRQLADVVEKIEQASDAYQASFAGVKQQEKDEALRRKQQVEEERIKALAKREDELLSRRYESLTGKPAAGASAPAVSARNAPVAFNDATKVKQAVQAVRAQPVQPPSHVRPKVTDVTFSRTLAGPVEELRIMDLTDFRRLSKNPEEAALKIKDKIDLLEEQGYEKRIAGIRAWRSSPMNQLYVLLSQEALMSGKGIMEILDERKAAGKETLREDELRAIMGLNAQLRF